jgi:type II restriction/modification system DNA methylase subunit YeeA
MNGMDVTRLPADKWIVDFGWHMDEEEAALFETPFSYIREKVKPEREKNNRETYRRFWWRHVESRQGMWAALAGRPRYIVTPTVAKHRLFVWLDVPVCPDHQLIVIARDDDTTFGILHSRFHEAWALRLGTSLEDRPRYTPSTTFETFPFPEGLTPNIPTCAYASDPRAVKIADAAKRLNELRKAWLNPPDLVKRVPEVVPGFPDRILPLDDAAAAILRKRTLTNLYNERSAWLANAHRDLDAAVAAAYGWPSDISEDDALARLFALNQSRAPVAGKAE